MNTLGYEFVQVEGYSDDFLMWKSKDEVDTKILLALMGGKL